MGAINGILMGVYAVVQGASIVCSSVLKLGQSGEPMSHFGLQLTR